MENARTHIIHHRSSTEQHTIGYHILSAEDNTLMILAAEARCHPNDNFNKKVARNIVETRLKSANRGNHHHRTFTMWLEGVSVPTTVDEWRVLENRILDQAAITLQTPASIRGKHLTISNQRAMRLDIKSSRLMSEWKNVDNL